MIIDFAGFKEPPREVCKYHVSIENAGWIHDVTQWDQNANHETIAGIMNDACNKLSETKKLRDRFKGKAFGVLHWTTEQEDIYVVALSGKNYNDEENNLTCKLSELEEESQGRRVFAASIKSLFDATAAADLNKEQILYNNYKVSDRSQNVLIHRFNVFLRRLQKDNKNNKDSAAHAGVAYYEKFGMMTAESIEGTHDENQTTQGQNSHDAALNRVKQQVYWFFYDCFDNEENQRRYIEDACKPPKQHFKEEIQKMECLDYISEQKKNEILNHLSQLPPPVNKAKQVAQDFLNQKLWKEGPLTGNPDEPLKTLVENLYITLEDFLGGYFYFSAIAANFAQCAEFQAVLKVQQLYQNRDVNKPKDDQVDWFVGQVAPDAQGNTLLQNIPLCGVCEATFGSLVHDAFSAPPK